MPRNKITGEPDAGKLCTSGSEGGRRKRSASHLAGGLPYEAKSSGALVVRLIVGLALLGWPRMGFAQGTWSVISLPQQSGDIDSPYRLAVDAAGNLYVVDD